MSVTIQFPPTMEQELREHANRQGMSLEQYITQVLIADVSGSNRQDEHELDEEELLQRINLNISPGEWESFRRLEERRKAELLTDSEHTELIALIHRIELAHAERMKYVVALAKLRGVPLEKLVVELGITPVEHE